MSVRVRFAPSPTGRLHIGSARTALFNYLFAKKHRGKYILRIEDTDLERNVEDAESGFFEGFQWLGLQWDEGPDIGGEFAPYRSMERLDLYRPYIDQLLASGKAYYCYCTKEEEEQERARLRALGKPYQYSGKCRHLSAEQIEQYEREGRSQTIRFRVPEGKEIVFHDMIRGRVHFHTDDIGDFIIVKSNGVPTYNFACTIDDALMKITHVIRGEEHLSNTPLQILLYEALDWSVPQFGHVPLILNPNGKKLSKRDESIIQFVEQYRALGYLPQAVINYLVLLGWSPPGEYSEQEIFSLDELIQHFSLDRVSKAGAIFDPEKLTWINSQYIKKLEIDELVQMSVPYLEKAGYLSEEVDPKWLAELVKLNQSGMDTISDIVQLSELFFTQDHQIDKEARQVLSEEQSPIVIEAFLEKLKTLDDYQPDTIKAKLKEVQKETKYRGRKLFMPIRVAATGRKNGPDLNTTLYLLGKEKVIQRLEEVFKSLVS